MRALLVVNPLSRRGARLGNHVRAELRHLGVEVVEEPVAKLDAIVVAGGDGTLVGQIPRALALGIPVGLVPLGTFNDLARALGLPRSVEGACGVIAAGRTRAIDAARVNGVYFMTEASIGTSSRLARLQTPEEKQRLGLLAIVGSVFKASRYTRPFFVEIEFDGKKERFKSVQLTVANSQRFGGFITVEDAAIDDGLLELYSVKIENALQFFTLARLIAARKRRSAQGVTTFRSAAFDVRTRHPHHITADGEPAGTTPARFEVLPRSLRVLVP